MVRCLASIFINPRRIAGFGYSILSVCLQVCVSVVCVCVSVCSAQFGLSGDLDIYRRLSVISRGFCTSVL